MFESMKFTDWPTVKESLIAKEIGGAFILAPMAMQLVTDGVPIKVVYLGHRDGTALVVAKDGPVRRFTDLRDKIIAVPSRYSNQNLLIHRLLAENGMTRDDVDIREVPPPEHPTALAAGSIDAYIVGEPFAAKGEMDGIGRVLHQTKDVWPGFISCVLVVRDDLIEDRPELIQELVDGIARSGKWLDEDIEHRMQAAEVAGKHYYQQPTDLLKFVLSKPPDRVKYTRLEPLREDFDEIMTLGVSAGVLSETIEFDRYVDPQFAKRVPEAWSMDRLPEETGQEGRVR
ncbi:MAG: ABC transporter substrate-binding protein [Planctomycetota bacterium]|nr:ABC transporter substrate-binding protein [Planctomycetota bacterium]